MNKQEKVQEVLKRLYVIYPEPKTALQYRTPWELLVATILSAQTTDKLVNTLTPALFQKFPTVQHFAGTSIGEIDTLIHQVNYHWNKAKFIRDSAKIIVEHYRGEVPQTMEELDALPGVARKTANVVLGNAYGKAVGVVVDTHVRRLSLKLGLTEHTDPVKIEQDLMAVVPQDKWIDFPHLLINVGREYCTARSHDESKCPLGDLYV